MRVDGLSSLHQLRELVLDRNKIKHLEHHSVRYHLPHTATTAITSFSSFPSSLPSSPPPYPS